MFGFLGVDQSTVSVPSSQITGQDIVNLVKDVADTGQKAYADYLFAEIMTKKAKNQPVQVPTQYAIQRGWTTGQKIGLGIGTVLLLSGIGLWLLLRKPSRGGAVRYAALPYSPSTVIDVKPVRMLPGA